MIYKQNIIMWTEGAFASERNPAYKTKYVNANRGLVQQMEMKLGNFPFNSPAYNIYVEANTRKELSAGGRITQTKRL
jgi:hypothetical protein